MTDKDDFRYVTFQWRVHMLSEPTEEDESKLLNLVCEDEETLGMEVFGVDIYRHGLNSLVEHIEGEYQPYIIDVKVKTHLQGHTDGFVIDESMVEFTKSRVGEVFGEEPKYSQWDIVLNEPETIDAPRRQTE